LVELLDACVVQTNEILVVYRHAGISLYDHLKKLTIASSLHDARALVGHAASGLAHMHAANVVHGDIHAKNVLVSCPPGGPTRFVVADLGSAFEAGPNWFKGVMEYNAPERLANAAFVGPLADVFSLGVLLAASFGEKFMFVSSQDEKVQLRAWCRQLGCPRHDSLPKCLRSLFNGIKPSPAVGFGPQLRAAYGSAAGDLLESMLSLLPDGRPSASEVPYHAFSRGHSLMGIGPLGQRSLFHGQRHDWGVQTGCLDPDVLQWLRADLTEGLVLGGADEHGKFAVTGRTDEHCDGTSMNKRPIHKLLPSKAICAWICALRELNQDAFAAFYVRASRRVAALAHPGDNGSHFLETAWHRWMFQAAELHWFPSPCETAEDYHRDGAASVLHLGLTLYGRRKVVCQQGDGFEPVELHQFPGAVYVGSFTGPFHQVFHILPKGPDEQKDGTSVSVMFRCTIFPHNRARQMAVTPNPPEVWDAVVAEVQQPFFEIGFAPSYIGTVPFIYGGLVPMFRSGRCFV
jgi:hypothetical protein